MFFRLSFNTASVTFPPRIVYKEYVFLKTTKSVNCVRTRALWDYSFSLYYLVRMNRTAEKKEKKPWWQYSRYEQVARLILISTWNNNKKSLLFYRTNNGDNILIFSTSARGQNYNRVTRALLTLPQPWLCRTQRLSIAWTMVAIDRCSCSVLSCVPRLEWSDTSRPNVKKRPRRPLV